MPGACIFYPRPYSARNRFNVDYSTELGHGSDYPSAVGLPDPQPDPTHKRMSKRDLSDCSPAAFSDINRFRLERFGKAMSGTGSWEAPGGVLSGKSGICMRCSNKVK